jgi:hypothetical protein
MQLMNGAPWGLRNGFSWTLMDLSRVKGDTNFANKRYTHYCMFWIAVVGSAGPQEEEGLNGF